MAVIKVRKLEKPQLIQVSQPDDLKPLYAAAHKILSDPKSYFRGIQPSLWNFYKHGVTASFLDSFLTCREQTRLAFVEGWSSRDLSLAIEFGSCCHWMLEQTYGSFPSYDDGLKHVWENLADAVTDLIKKYHQKWLSQVDAPTQRQLQQQEFLYGLAEGVLPTYFRRWDGDFNGGKYTFANNTVCPVKWVSLEEVFESQYTYPDGLQVPIRGRRDGVFISPKGGVWIFDTKCRSVIKDDEILETLSSDLQQMLYATVTMKEMKENPQKYGGRTVPTGTVMNIIRRPGQRQKSYPNLKSLLEKVRSEVSNPKKFDHYFIRYQMVFEKDEIQKWKKETLDPLMLDVRGWYEGTTPHYAAHRNLTTKYGKCFMYLPMVKNDYTQCYRRSVPFNELQE